MRTLLKTGLPVYILLENEKIKLQDIPEDFAYVVTKKGTFIKKKNFLYEGFFSLKEPSFMGEVEDTVYILERFKIPENLFLSIEGFFEEVYKKHQSEVAVVLYFCKEKEKWGYCVPQQTVSGASVKYDLSKGLDFIHEDSLETRTDAIPEGYAQVGSIHSHASMSAFHSGTDNSDEFNFDGIHITIGGFNKPQHEYACRMIISGNEYKKNLSEVVDFPTKSGIYPKDIMSKVEKPVIHIQETAWSGVGSYYGRGGVGYNDSGLWDYAREKQVVGKSGYPFSGGTVIVPGEILTME